MASLPFDTGTGVESEPSRSIRGPNDSSFDRIEDTFYSMMSIEIPHPIGSMSISPANRDVALGARKGLFIVDLQNPYDPPRFLPHYAGYREVADVQWNPFPARSEWVVSTSNQKAVVYNLSLSPSLTNSPIEHTLHAHTRAVTDINWSPNSSEVLATCALDGWVWSWDLRTGYGSKSGAGGGRKPVWGVCSWGSGATQVKWNRREPHVIASAHDNRVMIWDDRMGAVPVTIINGHSAKIYGIDWSRRDPKMLITCSLDKSFKSWHINKPEAPDLTVVTSTPVWRARYLPFGRGALTLPQRGDHALSIWGREKIARGDTAQPVARFEGAREGVKEFVWRTRGGDDLENDDREFQLVTWSKDRRLRLWPISDEIMKEVGQIKGSKIEVQMTRRKCPNISYRTFGDHISAPFTLTSPPFASLLARTTQEKLPQPSNLSQVIQASPLRTVGPSLLTSSLVAGGITSTHLPPNATVGAGGFASTTSPINSNRGSATMTTTAANHHTRTQNAHDRLIWMEGVKVIKPLAPFNTNLLSPTGSLYPSDLDPNSNEEDLLNDNIEVESTIIEGSSGGIERSNTITSTNQVGRGRGRSLALESDLKGVETRSSSLQRGTDGGITLREGGDTERAESALMSGSRTTAHAGPGGISRDSVHANLGEEVTSVVRRFPRVNFEKVHVAGRTCTVSLYSPIFLRATFTFPKSYPHTSPPTIELERNADITLKARAFLLQSLRKLMASRAQLGLPSLEFALRFLLGDRSDLENGGRLIGKGVPLVAEDDDDEEGDETLRGLNLTGSQTLGRNINVPPPRRGGAIFGPRGQLVVFFPTNVFTSPINDKEENPDSNPTKTKFPIRVSEAFGNLTGERESPNEDEYQETDEALQLSTGISFRLSGQTHPKRSANNTSISLPASSFSTTVHIKDISHLTLLQPERICNFLNRPPIEVAHAALDSAVENRDALLVHLWSTLSAFLEHSHESAFGLSRQFETVLAERLLPELLSYFGQLRDIQTLGVVACLLEVYRRALATSAHPTVVLPDPPPDDYFSTRATNTNLSFTAEDYDPTTPHASNSNPNLLPDSSPKASWTNLGALFNNSVLSLRGGTPPTPGTLDRLYQSGIARPLYSAGLSSPRISKISPRIRTDSNSPNDNKRSGSSGSGGREKKPSLERQQSRIRVIKEIPVVTFGDTSTISGKGKGGEVKIKKRVVVRYKDPCTNSAPVHWWLTERAQTELELIRLAYAELLYRWGLDNDRVEVLKLCRSSSIKAIGKNYGATLIRAGNGFDKDYGVDLTRSCRNCKAALHAPYLSCSACHTRQKANLCIVCHLPVLKLSQNCTICCHSGHVDCLQRWYAEDESCPSGCGCSCIASGGLQGVFIAELPEIVKPKITLNTSSFRPKSFSFRNSLPYFTA